ncbi:MAG: NADH-quinone oxidoreductase subunit A [Armatimonadetes bacterium]|nr:NADH-quinone oxidoreductase subunit A [Armatimonadota bacterium]
MLVGLSGFTVIMGLSIVVALVITAVGNDLAVKTPDNEGKLAPYACGAPVPATKVRMNVEKFFIYAVYFMIFDILGFVLATTISRPVNLFLPLFYAGTSIISIVMLTAKWR